MFSFIVSSSLSYSFYLISYSSIQRVIYDISYGRIVELSGSETDLAVILLLSTRLYTCCTRVLQHATGKQTQISN
jgi:hypothetical protein